MIIKALKLEAQEAECYAKLMMMIIYLAYNMNIVEKNEKILAGSHCFCIGATSIERAKTISIFYFKYAGAE